MKITISKIAIRNFKGIKSLDVELLPGVNSIRGANATGKTTILDSFLWTLFGVDSSGRADFNIKTLDPDGTPIHYLDHEVEVTLKVEDQKIALRRLYQEKWVKSKGKAEAEFSGHESTYYIDGVPVTMREYNTKVATLCENNMFKILTNPLYFPNMPWAEQRKILFDIAGEVSDDDLNLTPLVKAMLRNKGQKSIEMYKREVAATKKKIKDELDVIPARIDENDRGIPQEKDWNKIEAAIKERERKIEEITLQMTSHSQQLEARKQKSEDLARRIGNLRTRQQSIALDVKVNAMRDINESRGILRQMEDSISQKEKAIESFNMQKKVLETETATLASRLDDLRQEWREINAMKFIMDESSTICPYCKKPLDEEDISIKRVAMEAAFNKDKAGRLESNVARGKELSTRVNDLKKDILGYDEKTKALAGEILAIQDRLPKIKASIPGTEPDISAILSTMDEWKQINEELAKLEEQYNNQDDLIATSNYSALMAPIRAEIDDLKSVLSAREIIETKNKRHEQLVARQKELAGDLASWEKEENAMEEYTRAMINAVEGKINDMFHTVKFKLFNLQVNGSLAETCEATINGVPWRDNNSAMKIASGIEIIDVLGHAYNRRLPVWIDNREGVTNIPDIRNQVINLYVDDSFKTLTIN